MENKRFALLIDADNISAKYIGNILEELSTYGITTYKRIYGDFTSSLTNGAVNCLKTQSFRYSSLVTLPVKMLPIPR